MNGHDHISEQAAAYVLGALDTAERDRVEDHMRGCAACRAEVDALAATTDVLAAAVPAVAPPDSLRARVLAIARSERPQAQPVVDAHAVASTTRPLEPRRRQRWPVVALIAATLAFVIAGQGWLAQRADLQRMQEQLDTTVQERDALRRTSVQQRRALDALAGAEILTASLAPPGNSAAMRVFWNRGAGVAVVTAFGMTPAAAGRTYQLWGIDTASGASPVSLGTFNVDAAGSALLTVTATGPFDVAAVTDEPAGGSPQPTTTPFLVGTFGVD